VILDLFKYPKEADYKVYTVNGKPNTDKADKGELIVAYSVPQFSLDIRKGAWRSWEFIVP